MKIFLLLCSQLLFSAGTEAQKIESITFNLYTDSLKKGFYNYINIDGKLSNGNWLPLTDKELTLSATGGRFQGNDLFIDSSYTGATVQVKAVLRSDSSVTKEVTIYIRKRGFTEPLKTADDIMNEMKNKPRKRKANP